MEWIDWAIVLFILLTVLAGLRNGFFRTVCAMVGLLLGLALACWNYEHLAHFLLAFVRIEALADVIAFLSIAVLVMGLAAIAGKVISKTVHGMGLGCLDRLAGGLFGFFQGALLVMLVILAALAFYPGARWLEQARLPRLFFGACHFSARMSPEELAYRLRHGLSVLEEEAPQWLHPGGGG
ncbi:MAG: CvpA family protein [Terracidiphilus sp.]|jgi:membrane protein required for colicin V production